MMNQFLHYVTLLLCYIIIMLVQLV